MPLYTGYIYHHKGTLMTSDWTLSCYR